jgi:hypothetical protein
MNTFLLTASNLGLFPLDKFTNPLRFKPAAEIVAPTGLGTHIPSLVSY